MNDDDDGIDGPNKDNVLGQGDLAATFWRVIVTCFAEASLQAFDWDDTPQSEQDGYMAAFRWALAEIEQAAGVPWTTVAGGAFDVFARNAGYDVAYDELPTPTRIAWEAGIRHLVNMCVYDRSEDGPVDEHEARIVEWFTGRLAEQTMTESEVARTREERRLNESLSEDPRPEPAAIPAGTKRARRAAAKPAEPAGDRPAGATAGGKHRGTAARAKPKAAAAGRATKADPKARAKARQR